MIEALFAPANWLAGHPERAYAIAIVFMLMGFVDRQLARRGAPIRPWAMFVPAAAWLLFAIHEFHVRYDTSRVDNWTVRLDLVITWPFMVMLTGGFIGLWLANLRRVWQRPPQE